MSKTRYRWIPVFGVERWCQFLGEKVVPSLCGRSERCCSSHVMYAGSWQKCHVMARRLLMARRRLKMPDGIRGVAYDA